MVDLKNIKSVRIEHINVTVSSVLNISRETMYYEGVVVWHAQQKLLVILPHVYPFYLAYLYTSSSSMLNYFFKVYIVRFIIRQIAIHICKHHTKTIRLWPKQNY